MISFNFLNTKHSSENEYAIDEEKSLNEREEADNQKRQRLLRDPNELNKANIANSNGNATERDRAPSVQRNRANNRVLCLSGLCCSRNRKDHTRDDK